MDQSIAKKSVMLPDEAAVLQFAELLATRHRGLKTATIYLRGELGAGKTTLVRGFLHGLGYHGKVKSPTYTLVEPYHVDEQIIYHFDLYRLRDPAELEAMGIRDYCNGSALLLIEWPERAENRLPPPDIIFQLDIVQNGRRLTMDATSVLGQTILKKLDDLP